MAARLRFLGPGGAEAPVGGDGGQEGVGGMGRARARSRQGLGRAAEGEACSGQPVARSACPGVNNKIYKQQNLLDLYESKLCSREP